MNRRVLAGLAIMITVAFGVKAEAAGWETDFAKASTNASKSDLYMLLDFSGSDWCGWCMKLDDEVFSKADFKKFAKQNLVCVLVDFPHQTNQSKKIKKQNDELAKEYGVQGYPTVIILSPEGDLVGRTGYQEGGAKKYVEDLKKMIDEHKQKHPQKEAEKQLPSSKPDAGDGMHPKSTTLEQKALAQPSKEGFSILPDDNREVRMWTSRSGAKTKGALVHERFSRIALIKKEDGSQVELMTNLLRQEDQQYLQEIRKQSSNKPDAGDGK